VRIRAGSLVLALPSGACRGLGLEEGSDFDWKELEPIAACAQQAPASDDTARYLATAERTAAKLAGYLEKRGYLPSVVSDAVARAIEYGWVDDARFARMFAASRPDLGRYRLALELRKRGVAPDLVEKALEGRSDREAAAGLAVLVRRKYGNLPRETALRRAVGFLVRRGISGSEAFRTAAAILGGHPDEES
jgi:regulatory protein